MKNNSLRAAREGKTASDAFSIYTVDREYSKDVYAEFQLRWDIVYERFTDISNYAVEISPETKAIAQEEGIFLLEQGYRIIGVKAPIVKYSSAGKFSTHVYMDGNVKWEYKLAKTGKTNDLFLDIKEISGKMYTGSAKGATMDLSKVRTLLSAQWPQASENVINSLEEMIRWQVLDNIGLALSYVAWQPSANDLIFASKKIVPDNVQALVIYGYPKKLITGVNIVRDNTLHVQSAKFQTKLNPDISNGIAHMKEIVNNVNSLSSQASLSKFAKTNNSVPTKFPAICVGLMSEEKDQGFVTWGREGKNDILKERCKNKVIRFEKSGGDFITTKNGVSEGLAGVVTGNTYPYLVFSI